MLTCVIVTGTFGSNAPGLVNWLLPSILVSDATVRPLPVANDWLLVNVTVVIAPLISTVAVHLRSYQVVDQEPQ